MNSKNRYRNIRIFMIAVLCLLSFTSFGSVDLQKAVEIGGTKQWISAKGAHDNDPVLLFLHGGPGNSVMSYSDKFTAQLEKYFIVVHWDQRGSGRTAKLNHSDSLLDVAMMERDAVDLIKYLCIAFSKQKIYLVGHSWGGFLGLKIANDHPELLEAYFAVSPMIHQNVSEQLALDWMKQRATEKNNSTELRELSLINIPFKTTNDLYYHRKWLVTEMGSKPPAKSFVNTWAVKWLELFREASAVDFFTSAPAIGCPIYFMVGVRDYQTNFRLTEQYFKMLKAEKKDLFWFSNSAHSPNITEAIKFQQIIISHRTIQN